MRNWPRSQLSFPLEREGKREYPSGGQAYCLVSPWRTPKAERCYAPHAVAVSAIRTPEYTMSSGGFCVFPHSDFRACRPLLAKRADRQRAWNHARPAPGLLRSRGLAVGRPSFQLQTSRKQCARDRPDCVRIRKIGSPVGFWRVALRECIWREPRTLTHCMPATCTQKCIAAV